MDELWTTIMKLNASAIENHAQAKRNLDMIELKSQIDENLDQVNVCLREFRKDDSNG